jgi:hypothetical protein
VASRSHKMQKIGQECPTPVGLEKNGECALLFLKIEEEEQQADKNESCRQKTKE